MQDRAKIEGVVTKADKTEFMYDDSSDQVRA